MSYSIKKTLDKLTNYRNLEKLVYTEMNHINPNKTVVCRVKRGFHGNMDQNPIESFLLFQM